MAILGRGVPVLPIIMPQARYAAATPPGTPISGTDTNGTTTEVASISVTSTDFSISGDGPFLRDDFNRADSSSLGANWSAVPSLSGGSATMGISSNQAIAPGLGIFYANVWFNNTYSSNEQVSVTLGTVDGSGTAQFQLLLQIPLSALSSNFTGYSLNLNFDTSSSLTASLYRFNSGTGTPLPSISAISYHSGSVFTFRKNGNLLYFLVDGVAITGLNGYTDAAALNTLSTLAGFGGYNSATLTVDNFYVGGLSEEVATVLILNQSKSDTDSGTGSDATGTIKRVSADTGSGSDVTSIAKATTDGTDTTFSTLLDDFNRSSGPTLGTNWTQMPSVGSFDWQIVGNEAKAQGAGTRYADAWNQATFGSNQEISVTIKTVDDISSGGNAELWLFLQILNPSAGGFDGYLVVMKFNTLITLTATLYRANSNSYTTLQGVSSIAYTSGTTVTFRKVGNDLFFLTDGSAIAGLNPFTDSTPLTALGTYVGFGGYNSNTLTVDNITGGGVRKDIATLTTAITSTDSGSGSDPESLNTGATTKSGTDTGTTSETATLTVAISTPDTGSGIEGTTTLTATITGTDTGTSSENTQTYLANQDSGTISEATALSASASNTDSGTDSEAATLTATASSSDSGTDSEAFTLTVAITSTDTGTASDTGSVGVGSNSVTGTDTGTTSETTILTVAITTPDTGTDSEATTLTATLTATDTGTDTETIGSRTIVLTDTGSAADATTLTATASSSDTGTDTEATALTATTSSSDAGSDSEASTLTATFTGTDTGTSSENTQTYLANQDSGTTSEATILVASASASDTGSGSDAATITASLTSSDTGTTSETGTANNIPISGSDTGSASDATALTATISNPESGSSSENGTISLATVDSGTSSETATLTVVITNSDSSTASEAGISYIFLPDSGTGTDTATVTASISTTDSGTDSEATTLTAVISNVDTGSGFDQGTNNIPVNTSDTGTTTETATLVESATTADTGTETETSVLHASLTTTDTGTDSESGSVAIGVINVSGTDTGTDSEAQTLAAAISDAQSGTSSETGSRAATSSDTGTSTETATLTATFSFADSGTTTETNLLTLRVQDFGTATELGYANLPIDGTETAHGTDTALLHAFITVTDTGHATEFAIKRTAIALLITEVHVYRHWSYQVQVAAYTVSAHKHVTLTKGGKHYDYKVFKHTNEATKELVYR